MHPQYNNDVANRRKKTNNTSGLSPLAMQKRLLNECEKPSVDNKHIYIYKYRKTQ